MIPDINTNKKFQTRAKELFNRCRKLNMSLVFITHSYFLFTKDVRLNSAYHLIMKIDNKSELQSIVINHLADIGYNNLMEIYREYTIKTYYLLTIDTTLPSNDPLRFRRDPLDSL